MQTPPPPPEGHGYGPGYGPTNPGSQGWPPGQQPGFPPHQQPPRKTGGGRKWLIIGGVGCLLPIILCVVGLVVFGVVIETQSPEIWATPGTQMQSKFRKKIENLGLVDPEDKIIWFYSDAVMSITEGMYFYTNDELILYSDQWQRPQVVIPMQDISKVDAHYDNSFLTDSTATVTLHSGDIYTFPVSSERGNDRRFVETLREKVKEANQ